MSQQISRIEEFRFSELLHSLQHMRFNPCEMRFNPCEMRFNPCEMRFNPCEMRFNSCEVRLNQTPEHLYYFKILVFLVFFSFQMFNLFSHKIIIFSQKRSAKTTWKQKCNSTSHKWDTLKLGKVPVTDTREGVLTALDLQLLIPWIQPSDGGIDQITSVLTRRLSQSDYLGDLSGLPDNSEFIPKST